VFTPAPSIDSSRAVSVTVASSLPAEATVLGVPVTSDGEVPAAVGVDRAALEAAGFTGKAGETLVLPSNGGPVVVATGVGDAAALDAAALRNAAGTFARAAGGHTALATTLTSAGGPHVPAQLVAQAVVEGLLLARYSYDPLRRRPAGTPVQRIALVTDAAADEVTAGAERGRVLAAAGALARDLANAPPAHLTATRISEVAQELAAAKGLGFEVFDKDALVEMGCGGLLGVNAGSAEPPRMIKLTYRPAGTAVGHLSLVGKGIMYDSGGISLKPSDAVHATMKNDMSGAGAVLAAMAALPELACPTAVTAWLMCTDNMPSGTAMKLGDVITMRGGTTVEVVNTDAEGRLVMADALVLATEEPTDAIVDIATLTGACLRALGPQIAGVMGNNAALIGQIEAASAATDEPVWELPLAARYRNYLDSQVADLKNLGGEHAGAISAALFLAEFVADRPWAHLDIAGPAQTDIDASWRTAGCSGFGARLLVELAMGFTPPGT
jgi:leucyl aminopeptidase